MKDEDLEKDMLACLRELDEYMYVHKLFKTHESLFTYYANMLLTLSLFNPYPDRTESD